MNIKELLRLPPLPKAAETPIQWGQLYGCAPSLAIADASTRTTGLVLLVTPTLNKAYELKTHLDVFLPLGKTATVFPDWETLPFDHFSPHEDIISERLKLLHTLPRRHTGILIVAISTLMHRLPPRAYLDGSSFVFKTGETLNINTFRETLVRAGYRSASQVMRHGEFAIRGSLIDLFPMGSTAPFRIDLFDDEVESIRSFDIETQRSTQQHDAIEILPAYELPLDETGINHFRLAWREQFSGNPLNCPLYESISSGQYAAGCEYYLPLFFETTATLFDYLPTDTTVIDWTTNHQHAEQFWEQVNERAERYGHDIEHPLLPSETLFLPVERTFSLLKNFSRITLSEQPVTDGPTRFNFQTQAPESLHIQHQLKQPLSLLQAYLEKTTARILFAAESEGRENVLLEMLGTINIRPERFKTWTAFQDSEAPIGIMVAPLAAGLILETETEKNLILIAESQLFGHQVIRQHRRGQRELDPSQIIRSLAELHVGDPVVHTEHGVGRYQGLKTMTSNDVTGEYLTITYANDSTLYVPAINLHLISRYTGGEKENAPLNRLGSKQWDIAKQKAAKKIKDTAAELLALYAKRQARGGFKFSLNETEYQLFASQFPFEETPDQQRAIDHVTHDMTQEKSMDRVICGDVGFGKTEVAMRATFIAASGGKQVALIAPTTLLVEQHIQNFRDRFANWPLSVAGLSRFQTPKEQTAVRQQIEQGKVDIVIGTHRLLQRDITFSHLGLIIIDEEHRFGVHQKEKLKSLRAEVDILTLTATPIPRTMNMAMLGLRDISIIATPPAKRLTVKTFVVQKNESIAREAMLREISRGGQVYYVHNRVQSIERFTNEIRQLVPEAKVGFAHGQMRERELEQIMNDFYHQKFNVLVCTTIIESGIDIPTANTMLIDRADLFGLSQLHQLRGRIGRSHHQAYAYLMTPPKKAMTRDAVQRLDAIAALEDLGVGFTLATHDLEIRGAGELLGEEQSGHIQSIGFEIYMDLLQRAIDSLKKGEVPDLDLTETHNAIEIKLHLSTLIPDTYLPDVHTRLMLYKRIANAENNHALNTLKAEIIDRFGTLPTPAEQLFAVTQLKFKAQKIGIKSIQAGAETGKVQFIEAPNINPATLIQLVQKESDTYQFAGPNALTFSPTLNDPADMIDFLHTFLDQLIA